jgi:hypothetical protein
LDIVERALKALKSLAKEDKVRQAVEKTHKDVVFLVLHQTTRHVDMGDRIQEELSKLTLTPSHTERSLYASDGWFKGGCLGQKCGAFKFSKMHALPLIDCVSGQPVTN